MAEKESLAFQVNDVPVNSKPRKLISFPGVLEFLEDSLQSFFKGKDEKIRERTATLSTEELVSLYESPEYEHLDGFQRLQKLHKIAPALLAYDSSKPLTTLFRFGGTGLHASLMRADFWTLFVFHVALALAYHGQNLSFSDGLPTNNSWPQISTALVSIPSAVIAFVAVFYLNQTFTRYLLQFTNVNKTNGTLYEFMLLVRVHLANHVAPDARVTRHKLCKLCVALHFSVYGNLPWNRKAKVDEWVWWYLQRNKVLTAGQVKTLKGLSSIGTGNVVPKELLAWLERGVWAAQSRGYFRPEVGQAMTDRLVTLRGPLDDFYTFTSGTLPFAYFSLLNFVVLVYLFIIAYSIVFVARYWCILGYFLILVVYMGILEIGSGMSNPLGNDQIDIPIFHMAQLFFQTHIKLINTDVEYEDELEQMKPVNSVGGEAKTYDEGELLLNWQ